MIWKEKMTLEQLTDLGRETMVSHLGIEFLEIGDDFLRARMPVDARTLQPHGVMHGGASCVLAETVASVAGNFCVDSTQQRCVGIEINTSHTRSVRSGWVTATATALHLGKTTQLWQISIVDEQGRLISMSRLRLAVLQLNFSR